MGREFSKEPKMAMAEFVGGLQNDVKKEILAEHLKVLRSYAEKVFVGESFLDADEEQDREVRIREVFAISESFHLTEKQIVKHLLKRVFYSTEICKCPTCQVGR